MVTGTAGWLLEGRPDLVTVWQYDQPLGDNRFDRVSEALHAAALDVAIANCHDGVVVVTSKTEHDLSALSARVNNIVVGALLYREVLSPDMESA